MNVGVETMPKRRVWKKIKATISERKRHEIQLPEVAPRTATSLHTIAQQLTVLTTDQRLSRIENLRVAADAKARAEQDRTSTRWQTGIATVIAFIAAAAGAYQGYVARKTLVDTRNDQRAWLRVTVFPSDLVWLTGPEPSRTPKYAAVMLKPRFVVSNVGHLPAFSVRGTLLGIATTSKTDPFGDKVAAADRPVCAELERSKYNDIEATVFPGEQPQINSFGAITTSVFFARKVIGAPFPFKASEMYPRATEVTLLLYGCVVYRLYPSDDFHYSMFTYLVQSKTVDASGAYPFTALVNVPADEIKLGLKSAGDDAD